MRILWLKSDLLLPLDTAGKLRTWHLLKHLAADHRITYLAFAASETSRNHLDAMREVIGEVVTVERSDPSRPSIRFYVDLLRRLVDPLPNEVGRYRSRAYRRALARLLATRTFDVIVCDFLPPAVNLPRRLPCPAVLFTHKVEAEIWRRRADGQSGFMRHVFRAQWRRMLRFEGRALCRFEGVLAVSEADRATFRHLYPECAMREIDVIPTGVDTSFFRPRTSPADSKELVFTGSMDWLPNEDAMVFFCRDVLPLVRADEPQVSLTIVGRAPTPRVQQLAGPGVTVTGRVDDVRPYLETPALFIVPLRIGGGTHLKVFEAMATGKAIVSTSIGAEGLPVTSGDQLLLADDPVTFARAIVQLLRDVPRRRALESAARELVVRQHDWSVVARELDAALRRHAGTPSPAVASSDLAPASP